MNPLSEPPRTWRDWQHLTCTYLQPTTDDWEHLASVSERVSLAINEAFEKRFLLRPIGSYATASLVRGHADFDALVISTTIADSLASERAFVARLANLTHRLGPVEIRRNRVGHHTVFNFDCAGCKVSLGVVGRGVRLDEPFEEIRAHPRFVRMHASDAHGDVVRLLKRALKIARADRFFPGFAAERLAITYRLPWRLFSALSTDRVVLNPVRASCGVLDSPRSLAVSYLFTAEDMCHQVPDEAFSALHALCQLATDDGPRVLLDEEPRTT